MTLPESKSVDTRTTRQKITEQNNDALISTHLPNQGDTESSLNLNRQSKS